MVYQIVRNFQNHQSCLMAHRRGTSFVWLFPTITKQTTMAITLLMLLLCLSAKFSVTAKKIEQGSIDVNICKTAEKCSTSMAKYIAHLSKKNIQEKGIFTIALSGEFPGVTMRTLLENPFAKSKELSNWYVFLTDGSVVSNTSLMFSNDKIVYEEFLPKVPIPLNQIISINNALSPVEAAADYETRLKDLVTRKVIAKSDVTGFPKFDVMLLGLGPNGQIASLFPNRTQLSETEKWVTSVEDAPMPPPSRVTMTFPVINSSSKVALVATGRDKAITVNKAVLKDRRPPLLPVQMVSLVDGELKWFLDNQAAALLPKS